MIDFFYNLNPLSGALVATIFTWALTALGASIVFFFKKVNKTLMDSLLSFAAGVMIAASFFSLITPALDMADSLNMISYVVVSFGFITGALFLFLSDKIYNKIMTKKGNFSYSKHKRCLMLILSITIHNIPEGMAIGVAFGSINYNILGSSMMSAFVLALGIGLQNFPEGSAVSLPLRRDGMSLRKAFFYGQLSGIVEPISAVIGVLLVMKIQVILPFLLSFAAGAMIYVVIDELIPESSMNSNKNLMSLVTILGFTLMMVLDVALG